jgi:hypothetical protein
MRARRETQIGKHRVVVEKDTVSVYWDGPSTVDEVRAIQQIYDDCLTEHAQLFSVFFVERAVPPSPEVRKIMADWRKDKHVCASAVIGASLAVRTMGGLYLRAAELVGLRSWPVRFFDQASEAYEFLESIRQKQR